MAFRTEASRPSRGAASDSSHRHFLLRWHESCVPVGWNPDCDARNLDASGRDRKFLGTGWFFVFDTSRVLTTVTKVRINYEIAPDGKTLTGTTEPVVFDPTGKVIITLAGASFTMVRLSFEIPGDFYDFQKLP
jgi:hypothetical protein